MPGKIKVEFSECPSFEDLIEDFRDNFPEHWKGFLTQVVLSNDREFGMQISAIEFNDDGFITIVVEP